MNLLLDSVLNFVQRFSLGATLLQMLLSLSAFAWLLGRALRVLIRFGCAGGSRVQPPQRSPPGSRVQPPPSAVLPVPACRLFPLQCSLFPRAASPVQCSWFLRAGSPHCTAPRSRVQAPQCSAPGSHVQPPQCSAQDSRCSSFSCCSSRALDPEPGLEPPSPALAGEFLTTGPPGSSPGFLF